MVYNLAQINERVKKIERKQRCELIRPCARCWTECKSALESQNRTNLDFVRFWHQFKLTQIQNVTYHRQQPTDAVGLI